MDIFKETTGKCHPMFVATKPNIFDKMKAKQFMMTNT